MTLFEQIRQSTSLMLSAGVNDKEIEAAQKKLSSVGGAPMPLSYTHFLRKINGIYGNNLSVFGINTLSPYEDIYIKNTIDRAISKNKIFLGVNLSEYLCYDWYQKSYIIINKASDKVVFTSTFFSEILKLFLRGYLK